MNEKDITPDHADHPEELLATYVGGEASEDERAAAQALLASCTECRGELDLAVQARAALQSLPELDAPGVGAEDIVPSLTGPARRPAVAAQRNRRRTRQWTWERVAWGAGIVAVGSLVALFMLLQTAPAPMQEQAAPAQRAAPRSGLETLSGERDYTPASMDALARRLATSARTALAAKEPQPSPAAPAGAPQLAGDTAGGRPVQCLRRGGGLPRSADALHVERATFRGTRAFIGAFRTPGPTSARYLLVLAVDRRTCDPLYVINRSL